MNNEDWYTLQHPEYTDSPALLIYPRRIRHNIREMLRMVNENADRLMPHVKTIKMPDIVKMEIAASITKFKCATIAEAEMLAESGAKKVLISYQLQGPKTQRLLLLIKKYPQTHFASLIDNRESAISLNALFEQQDLIASVYVDVDNGMHRTGFPIENDLVSFYKELKTLSHLNVEGLHVYDGHLHQADLNTRRKQCEADFGPVRKVVEKLTAKGAEQIEVIAGGSPTFPFHAANPNVICSPGTTLLWDAGYQTAFPELPFLPAAVLLTRIISKPKRDIITADLGHKSVAAENPIEKRISFLNIDNYKVRSQSEEHLVIQTHEINSLKVGDVLYGLPYHICPTVALYDEAGIVEDGIVKGQWEIVARRKKISI